MITGRFIEFRRTQVLFPFHWHCGGHPTVPELAEWRVFFATYQPKQRHLTKPQRVICHDAPDVTSVWQIALSVSIAPRAAFLEACFALWARQLITAVPIDEGMDSLHWVCEPSLPECSPWFSVLLRRLGYDGGAREGCRQLNCPWMYSKISYKCRGLICTSFPVRGHSVMRQSRARASDAYFSATSAFRST